VKLKEEKKKRRKEEKKKGRKEEKKQEARSKKEERRKEKAGTLSSLALSYFFISLFPLKVELAERKTYFGCPMMVSCHVANHVTFCSFTTLPHLFFFFFFFFFFFLQIC
jgi:hypothetical protein